MPLKVFIIKLYHKSYVVKVVIVIKSKVYIALNTALNTQYLFRVVSNAMHV